MSQKQVETKPTRAAGTSVSLWEKVELGRWLHPAATFQNPEQLWEAALEYFRWLDANPHERERVTTHEGQAYSYVETIQRMPTWHGLCAHIGMSRYTVDTWMDPTTNVYRPDLMQVLNLVKDLIHDTKLSAGFAGIANAGLVARDLKLGDRMDIDQKTETTTKQDAIDKNRIANQQHPDATPEWLDAWYAAGLQPPLYSQEQIDNGIALPPAPMPVEDE